MRYRAVFPILIIVFALSGCTLSTINPVKKSRIDNIHHTQILFFLMRTKLTRKRHITMHCLI